MRLPVASASIPIFSAAISNACFSFTKLGSRACAGLSKLRLSKGSSEPALQTQHFVQSLLKWPHANLWPATHSSLQRRPGQLGSQPTCPCCSRSSTTGGASRAISRVKKLKAWPSVASRPVRPTLRSAAKAHGMRVA